MEMNGSNNPSSIPRKKMTTMETNRINKPPLPRKRNCMGIYLHTLIIIVQKQT